MQVVCGQCGRATEAEAGLAGATVLCPRCGESINVPALDADTEPAPSAPPPETPDGYLQEEGFAAEARAAMEKKIRVLCGSCGRGLWVGVRLSGKQLRCPACEATIQIPAAEEDEEKALESVRLVAVDPLDPNAVFVPTFAREGEAREEEQEEAQAPPRRPRDRLVAAAIALAALGIAAVCAAVLFSGGGETPNESTARNPSPTAGGQPVATPSPTVPPVTPEPTVAPRPTPTPAPTAPPTVALVRSVHDAFDYFAQGGYFPAPPGKLYWKITVEIQVVSGQLAFDSYGGSVVLRAPRADGAPVEYPSLGVVGAGGVVAQPARRERISVPAGTNRKVAFLFEVPGGQQQAKLIIRKVDEITIGPTQPPRHEPPNNLVGRFAEAPPRNLKPALADPVMSALQRVASGQLVIRRQNNQFQLSFPVSGIAGSARHLGGDIFQVNLSLGAHSLACKLRLIDRGGRLILYLSEAPFHQITYTRRS